MYCNWKYAWLWLIAFLSCEKKEDPAATDLPYYGQADFTPLWLEPHDEQLQEFHHVHPFRLYDQEGSIITEQDLDGKITVANFFFSICPSVCPKMTDNLLDVQEALLEDRQTLLLSHTVMPWVDSVARLKQFALEKGVSSHRWHLLTGPKEELYRLARESYFADEGFGKSVTSPSQFLHTENVWLLDPQRRIRGIYNGTLPLEMTRLLEDVSQLKHERDTLPTN